MSEKLLKDIANASKTIRKKYKALKSGLVERDIMLEDTFKPITGPLKMIANSKVEHTPVKKPSEVRVKRRNVKSDVIKSKIFSKNSSIHGSSSKNKNISTSLNNSSNDTTATFDDDNDDDDSSDYVDKDNYDADNDDNDSDDNSFKDALDSGLQKNTLNNLTTKYFNYMVYDSRLIDKIYGVRMIVLTGGGGGTAFKIGSSTFQFSKNNSNDFTIDNVLHKGTPGIYELIFLKNPKNFDDKNLVEYSKILQHTNAHRRNYSELGQINGNKSKKYLTIIAKIMHEGSGLMRIPGQNYEHIYWNDPNELVSRLQLLQASEAAGNNGHNNEIQSILEELREANIIH